MTEQNPAAMVDGVRISWERAREANLANWEDRVPLHLTGYDLQSFRDNPDHLSSVVSYDLPVMLAALGRESLDGLALCHLQCHIGTDTVSLARAGASVTGVDFSPSALAAASSLAAELGIDARWVETDVLDARSAVTQRLGEDAVFDIVYTSIGTIGWLADIEAWAAQVAALLAPGGLFYIRDGHPALYSIDETIFPPQMRYRYFADGTALQIDEASTYAGEGTLDHRRTYEYPRSIADVVNALLAQSLVIERMEEGKTLPWKFADYMVDLGDGDFAFPEPYDAVVPCTFTLVARKPAAKPAS